MEKYTRYESGNAVDYTKKVLALYQQCKDDGLTAGQALYLLNAVKRRIEQEVLEANLP